MGGGNGGGGVAMGKGIKGDNDETPQSSASIRLRRGDNRNVQRQCPDLNLRWETGGQ